MESRRSWLRRIAGAVAAFGFGYWTEKALERLLPDLPPITNVVLQPASGTLTMASEPPTVVVGVLGLEGHAVGTVT